MSGRGTKIRNPEDPTCWTCRYQQVGGMNFLGFCTWFVDHKKEGAKPIPATVVDAGCEFYERGANR